MQAEVEVPAGVDNGMQIRMTGQGEPSPNGGPPGDCYCVVAVLPHPLFEREGQHLVCRVPITYSQAVLGATLEVPTLDGPRRGEGAAWHAVGRRVPPARQRPAPTRA